jgi:predicted DsbA family dithiol-disulfide isomerase
MRLDEYFPPERLASMADHMTRFAAQFGLHDFRQRDRIPNTRRALALAEVAREEGKLDAFRHRAMDAHWKEAMNLENDDDLRAIAQDAGLADDAVERSLDPRYLARVDAMREEANAIGVEGIPTTIIGQFGISGCQPYEVFAQVAERAGAKKKPSSAGLPPGEGKPVG